MATSVINDIKNYKVFYGSKVFASVTGNQDITFSLNDQYPAGAHVVALIPIGQSVGSTWDTFLIFKEVIFGSDGVTPTGISMRVHGSATQNYSIRFCLLYY